jgi:FKBP-type peptidyl-prolyl cis-trans isomerase FklB
MQSAAQQNIKEEAAFLAQNAQAEGVQSMPSGLQFKVLKQGNGATPGLTDSVQCHYRGTLLDGTEFDSSYGGDPARFPVNGVIPGWTEALQKMKAGDKWQLFVPAKLAYGANPPGPPIEPNSMLIFEVELLGVDQR